MLSTEKMPEAEVSLRLAFFLIEKEHAASDVSVAIDGAQVRTKEIIRFPIVGFLVWNGWKQIEVESDWRGTYANPRWNRCINVHSRPGRGDVVAKLASGQTLRAECKKGTLERSKSSQEYPLIREALGQLLTVEEVGERDILAVGVPSSEKFDELATRWREAPLIKRFDIQILTVDRKNNVNGFAMERSENRACRGEVSTKGS